jgi:uncharacterized protein (DUF934 family)
MHKIIKDGAIVDDNWTIVTNKEITSAAELPDGNLLLPLTLWENLKDQLSDRKLGVWLNSDESPTDIKDTCKSLPLIGINFPVFTDGRGYSFAHILRAQYGYQGELRAIGDVLMDQLFFMKRCGFNSFSMRADQKLDIAVQHLSDFNISYQAAIDKTAPLFQSR